MAGQHDIRTPHMTREGGDRLPPAVVRAVSCPVCGESLTQSPTALRCPAGHSFDIARQGYVNFLGARPRTPLADSTEMATARSEFLAAGHYAALADNLAALVARLVPGGGLVVDAGAGTGYYLAVVLDHLTEAVGLALDSSTAGLRRAARAHSRAAAIGWDVWQPWPLRTGSAAAILNVFAPRNPDEFHRVLAPEGTLAVVTPTQDHLAELRAWVDLLGIQEDKLDQVDTALAGRFRLVDREPLSVELALDADDVRRLVQMGPNAHHLDRGDRRARLAALRGGVEVTASFVLSAYRPVH
ncbi:putative RNA methyltransferase [Actinopolymorpha pittospori]|uniref:23S rRNA (Guanine745-N1)-methyltransferase n=1 Tax=Actinopolymorpha pittospori TaxID=648752 RepID=A0A927MTN0_9ACTN|nr:rRNA (guanine-N1)-methyltransferase [Actinopolymorpha pittospori]MBE1606710.1 23S rRNA (guanine745-N1)-methyltransferase [Actinopolymorpha pittospori]